MIRTLRRKFVLINMLLVSVVLAAVVGAVLVTTAQSAKQETEDALRRCAFTREPVRPEIAPRGAGRPDLGPGMGRIAVFWVRTDETGTIVESDISQVEISDETLSAVTAAALAAGTDSGTLSDPALRFLCDRAAGGVRIAFADRAAEQATVRRTAVRLGLVTLAALAAFLCISVFLARWALRPVERAWQRQREFVADASHELKTPLTVILAGTELMARHPDETVAQQRQWLDSIREEGARMKQLIDDLLFLARADTLRTPELCAVDWSEVTESAALAFESVAFEKGITLETEIAPGLTVQGDAAQLTQLAQILLDNACKYAGDARRVTLALRPAGNLASLAVCNTGDTLPPEQLDRLFERFYRADPARAEGGHGLGLAIARSIARTHHGQIRADSSGGLTTLTVTLPLRNGAENRTLR
ncbi:MAG: sensor histidine kinase [Gemmiger sp.]